MQQWGAQAFSGEKVRLVLLLQLPLLLGRVQLHVPCVDSVDGCRSAQPRLPLTAAPLLLLLVQAC